MQKKTYGYLSRERKRRSRKSKGSDLERGGGGRKETFWSETLKNKDNV